MFDCYQELLYCSDHEDHYNGTSISIWHAIITILILWAIIQHTCRSEFFVIVANVIQIFSALIIVCGAVTLSRVRERQISCSNRDYRLSETTTKYNPLLICSALLLAICGVTLLLEMILLTVSFVLKCNKIFTIVVSYMCTHPSS